MTRPAIDEFLAALIASPRQWLPGGALSAVLRRLTFLGAVDSKMEARTRWRRRVYRANRYTRQYLAATPAQRQYLGRNGGFKRG
jgi:hypothetical protein